VKDPAAAALLVKVKLLADQIRSVFVGGAGAVDNLLTGFLSGLHVLVEDIPGVGKTTLAKALARSAGLDFARIQFTPDLLPGDVIGMTVWSIEQREFVFKPGAIMHQFLLADEINRASARTQSCLLEAMQEHAVSVDGVTYALPEPFFVIATQNPASFAGTFPLPEAQVDRFGVSFSLGYPSESDEHEILRRFQKDDPAAALAPVITPEEITGVRRCVREVHIDPAIRAYVTALARRTRASPKIRLGMSPRASLHLLAAAQAAAFLAGRDFVVPEDVVAGAPIVVPHRLSIRAEARLENETPEKIVRALLSAVRMPAGL
jgi:MoxR-like ATPase